MKVTVAMDSFKGSLSSLEAGQAVRDGILQAVPDAKVMVFPLADGGEGIAEVLAYAWERTSGEEKVHSRTITVTGPLGETREASYILLGNCAIIEMAEAAGLCLVPEDKRNPLYTTTYGVGEMIQDAIRQGCRDFIVGIGGSATNDGGVGMLQALGFDFWDECGNQVNRGAEGLGHIREISDEKVAPELRECTFRVACDVDNPLVGELGCSKVFAPQKGVQKSQITFMENAMNHYADIAEEWWQRLYEKNSQEKNSKINRYTAGAGAAGGLGFAFLMFLNGKLVRGVDLVLNELHIESEIIDSDYVITGEGKLDKQTSMGKAPAGIAKLAKRHGKKIVAFVGSVEGELLGELKEELKGNLKSNFANGLFDACIAVADETLTLEENMKKENAKINLQNNVANFFESEICMR